MIKHHPSDQILAQFVKGELSPSISVAVSIHVEMCSCCQEKIELLTVKEAEQHFAEDDLVESDSALTLEMADMFEQITLDESLESVTPTAPLPLNYGDTQITLPRALNQLQFSDWSGLGKVSRKRVKLDDEHIRSSLLHIEAGGEIPEHTHTGQEVTVLLDGSFSDEMGEYNKGDFIWLDGQHQHQPVTKNGCLCYAVVTDPLHFTQGISRLLNPIGKLIY